MMFDYIRAWWRGDHAWMCAHGYHELDPADYSYVWQRCVRCKKRLFTGYDI